MGNDLGCVVRVHADGEVRGSGFLIAPEWVLTCKHVVVEREGRTGTLTDVACRDLRVDTCDGLPVCAKRSPYLAPSWDLALLELEAALPVSPLPLLWGLTESQEPHLRHAPIWVYGYPEVESTKLWQHPIRDLFRQPSARAHTQILTQLQLTGGIPQGCSGGPALLRWGEQLVYVGTVYLGGEKSPTSRLIMADPVAEFLHEAGLHEFPRLDAPYFFGREDNCQRLWAAVPEQAIYVAAGDIKVQNIHGAPNNSFPARTLFQVEALPEHFVSRPEVTRSLTSRLLASTRPGVLAISALYGLGGVGKTILVRALSYEKAVQARFTDGVLWATLGQEPDVLSELKKWIDAITMSSHEAVDYRFESRTIGEASSRLRSLLEKKAFLLIVDDAWAPEDVVPFRHAASPTCQLLLTTRRANVAEEVKAELYRLDVMTAGQSVALFSKHLNRRLEGTEKNLALQVARMVGYLPLALELAAARIRHGVPWDDLQNALKEETARLEVLDSPLDQLESEETKLEAVFNVSLHALRARTEELWRAFLWLGVLAEDAQFSAPMAATLWQMSTEKALLVLEVLSDEALLLPAFAVQAGERQWPSYRVHDLVRDVARRHLLGGSENGLGFPSLAEAHATLLERYRARTRDGLWHTLEDDGYIHSHLAWHMERADQGQEIHLLLQEETEDGLNGWYQATDRLGQTGAYLADVHRAWRIAEEADHRAIAAGEMALSLETEVRCALHQTSINSVASNIPLALLSALLDSKKWTVAQGLTYARQIHAPQSRAEALVEVATQLKGHDPQRSEVLRETLAAARAILEDGARAHALNAVAPHLPEAERAVALKEALATALDIGDKGIRVQALSALSPRLPEAERGVALEKALTAVRAVGDDEVRALALSALAQHLPEAERGVALQEALAAVRDIGDDEVRALALSALAQHLPEAEREGALEEALAAAQAVEDEEYRAHALTVLAPHLPVVERGTAAAEALAAARAILEDGARAHALNAVAPHLPEAERAVALKEALATALDIGDKGIRVQALSALSPRLPEAERGVALGEALATARGIGDEEVQAKALITLAPRLLEEERGAALAEALAAARDIGDEEVQALALTALAPRLAEAERGGALQEALAAARGIGDEEIRALVLTGLAPHLPEAERGATLAEALAAARTVEVEEYRALALTALAPHLLKAHQGTILAEALVAAQAVENEEYQALALSALAPYLPEGLQAKALATVRDIGDDKYRAQALTALGPHLPEAVRTVALKEGLAAARAIGDQEVQALALTALAPRLAEADQGGALQEALAVARCIGDEEIRAQALSALAPHMTEELLAKALAVARAIGKEGHRAQALTALVPYLPRLSTSTRYSIWRETLHALATLPRKDLLLALDAVIPIAAALGGRETVGGIYHAIQDVCRWWP